MTLLLPRWSPATRLTARWAIGVIGLITLWRIGLAALLPITQDESYYAHWATALAWGYFDHPPGVAVLSVTHLLAAGNALVARLGTLVISTLTLFIVWRLYWQCGLRDHSHAPGVLTLALVLVATTMPGVFSGIITTPDTLLACCWALALHETHAALQPRQHWRWLTVGVAVGAGLLSKYTLVFIAPIILWVIIRHDMKTLRQPWLYAGVGVALLIWSPHLWWNATHDWLTLRFQFGHGFSLDPGAFSFAATQQLPAALLPITPPVNTPLTISERLVSVAGFIGSQLSFWAVMLIPVSIAAWRWWRHIDPRQHWLSSLSPIAQSLLITGTLIPLLLFSGIASVSSVEANWAAMYLITAAPLFALFMQHYWRGLIAAAVVNSMLISVYIAYAALGSAWLPAQFNRLGRETHGFAELAQRLRVNSAAPVFADRYQLAAMLNFYQPSLAVTQWPGITRPSEYLRSTLVSIPALTNLQRTGFWLVTSKLAPPTIPGFIPTTRQLLADCGAQSLATWQWQPPCVHPLHVWQVAQYQPQSVL